MDNTRHMVASAGLVAVLALGGSTMLYGCGGDDQGGVVRDPTPHPDIIAQNEEYADSMPVIEPEDKWDESSVIEPDSNTRMPVDRFGKNSEVTAY